MDQKESELRLKNIEAMNARQKVMDELHDMEESIRRGDRPPLERYGDLIDQECKLSEQVHHTLVALVAYYKQDRY